MDWQTEHFYDGTIFVSPLHEAGSFNFYIFFVIGWHDPIFKSFALWAQGLHSTGHLQK